MGLSAGWMNVSAPGGNYFLASNGLQFQKQRKAKDGAFILQLHYGYQLNKQLYFNVV
jgi:hypothetical protein